MPVWLSTEGSANRETTGQESGADEEHYRDADFSDYERAPHLSRFDLLVAEGEIGMAVR